MDFDILMAIKIAGIFITKVRKKHNPFIKVSKPNPGLIFFSCHGEWQQEIPSRFVLSQKS